MEKFAEWISVIYVKSGFLGGSLAFLAACLIFSYALIKKRYSNVFICEALRDVYDDYIDKGEESKISKVLVANGYSLLGHPVIDVAKIIFALLYVFTLKTEALSFVDSSILGFPLLENVWAITNAGGLRALLPIGLIILIAFAESINNRVIARNCFVESDSLDTATTIAVSLSVLLLPGGYGLFLFAFSVAELAITLLNLGPLRGLNMKKIAQAMGRYNTSYRAKVLNEIDTEKKTTTAKPHRQPSALHPSKKKKK